MYRIKNFKLWQSPVHFSGKYITGEEVYIEIVKTGILGTCIELDDLKFFAANPNRIPNEWEGKRIYAWGTIEEHDGEEYVPCLNCINPDIPKIVEHCLCLEWNSKDFVMYEVWNDEPATVRTFAHRA